MVEYRQDCIILTSATNLQCTRYPWIPSSIIINSIVINIIMLITFIIFIIKVIHNIEISSAAVQVEQQVTNSLNVTV